MSKVIKNLGYMNGWYNGEPEEYKKHRKALEAGEEHEMTGHSGGNCVSVTTCHTCGITWKIDSSG